MAVRVPSGGEEPARVRARVDWPAPLEPSTLEVFAGVQGEVDAAAEDGQVDGWGAGCRRGV